MAEQFMHSTVSGFAGATMASPWTSARDQCLLELQAAGRSTAEIAKVMGTTRSAVIGRSLRLRGIVYQSSIDSWKRANAKAMAKRRAEGSSFAPPKLRRKVVRAMLKAIARGMPRNEAIYRANQAGAMWREIGDCFGISRQAAHFAGTAWKRC
jgi:hypothetical protein